ncbi:hypothetical protein B9Z19DRAFT_1122170 [Tuber borchii]|uniref:RNase H type-1 domain-containing protein n=1 Tax=Tuber borchii TaxID=42251 RepID=A0A2T7A0Z7_TUBBO|nr:hypothetical protein B9Z19DRAFT_1122170 [Tuber borchii]
MSKTGDAVECAWITIERGMADTPRCQRLPGQWGIMEVELMGILGSLREWTGTGRSIRIHSDCLPAILMLRDMTPEGDTAMLFHLMAEVLNNINGDVGFGWLPSHVGIPGNEMADMGARSGSRIAVLPEYVESIDFGLAQVRTANRLRAEEWRDYHISFDRTYYDRGLAKPRFMKGLSRMDYYYLIRL